MEVFDIIQHHFCVNPEVYIGRVRVPSGLVVKHSDSDVLKPLLLR